jgi:hypothetical protein
MPASLANRVRGEQVPLNGAHLRLLEVVVTEEQVPLWKARCLQTGNLLTVALDGLVQVPNTPSITLAEPEDYIADYRRHRRRRFGKYFVGSILVAALAFYFSEPLATFVEMLRKLSPSDHSPGLPR